MPARAEHLSPLDRVATATTVPVVPEITRRREKDPLGARVVGVAEATTAPFLRSVTFHGVPLRFWSTSNSTSMRLSSRLSFNVAVELCVHCQRTLIGSPPLADASGAETRAAQLRPAAARLMMRKLCMSC